MNMSRQKWGNDLQQPLHRCGALSPLSHESNASSGYCPPNETMNAFSGASSFSKRSNLMHEDDIFMSKMKSLINLHESTNLRVEDAIESSFPSPGEQKLFHDVLQFRMANLPMFPEAGETAMNQMVREINQRFGRALRNVSTRKQSSS